MFFNKPKIFDSFCWHYDEIKSVPSNSIILASNDHSLVQALSFKLGRSEFWGVQYHPEFNPRWMLGLMKLRKKTLLEKKIYCSENEFNQMIQALSDLSNNRKTSYAKKIKKSIIERNIHYLELTNWLRFVGTSF